MNNRNKSFVTEIYDKQNWIKQVCISLTTLCQGISVPAYGQRA